MHYTTVEPQILELTASLVGNRKELLEALDVGGSTFDQQLRGVRALPLRVVHEVQRRAGRWPVYAMLNQMAGLAVGDLSTAALLHLGPGRALMRALAEVGEVSRKLDAALDADSPGGAEITPDEAALLEPLAQEHVNAAINLLHAIQAHARVKGAA